MKLTLGNIEEKTKINFTMLKKITSHYHQPREGNEMFDSFVPLNSTVLMTAFHYFVNVHENIRNRNFQGG